MVRCAVDIDSLYFCTVWKELQAKLLQAEKNLGEMSKRQFVETGMGRYAFLLAAGIALFGALIHLVAPLLGPEWYAFLRAPAAVVASARGGTALAPAGTVGIGLLMLLCGFYALAGAGAAWLRWLPFAPQAQGTIAAVCLLRGLLIVPYWYQYSGQLAVFDVAASCIWLAAGLAFSFGVLVTRSQPMVPTPAQPH